MSIGNCDTLELRPQAQGLDTRDELIKFYREYYSANLMHLAVYSKGMFSVWVFLPLWTAKNRQALSYIHSDVNETLISSFSNDFREP